MALPKTLSDRRQKRAKQVTLLDVRRVDEEVWECDLLNESGKLRENVTIIPSRIYSPSKDMQHRGPDGVVGKYIRALAMHDPDARDQLLTAIRERRDRIQGKIRELREEDSNLLHAQADMNEL